MEKSFTQVNIWKGLIMQHDFKILSYSDFKEGVEISQREMDSNIISRINAELEISLKCGLEDVDITVRVGDYDSDPGFCPNLRCGERIVELLKKAGWIAELKLYPAVNLYKVHIKSPVLSSSTMEVNS